MSVNNLDHQPTQVDVRRVIKFSAFCNAERPVPRRQIPQFGDLARHRIMHGPQGGEGGAPGGGGALELWLLLKAASIIKAS